MVLRKQRPEEDRSAVRGPGQINRGGGGVTRGRGGGGTGGGGHRAKHTRRLRI